MLPYDTTVHETTGITLLKLLHNKEVTAMLHAMQANDPTDDATDDAQLVTQRAEEVLHLARLRINVQQRVDAGRSTFV